jgi:L-ribulokinase
VDFGTSAVRVLILDTATGEEVAQATSGFPLWEQGEYCDPAKAIYRQHPEESLESLCAAVSAATSQIDYRLRRCIAGITIDSTGSTPLPVDNHGQALALRKEFHDEPDALCILWKDHSAARAADAISKALVQGSSGAGYLDYSGGTYSPEWFWAKVLHIARTTPAVATAAATWVEHCDWLAATLAGVSSHQQIVRSRCGSAHKALWNSAFGGFPPVHVFEAIHPYLGQIRRTLPDHTVTADRIAGHLSAQWAKALGLEPGTPIGVGLFDAHAGAIGAGVRPGGIAKTMGTSSADMIVASSADLATNPVPGVESQAEGSIIPGLIGIEAGQPAFGDIFAWFGRLLARGAGLADDDRDIGSIIGRLEEAASERMTSFPASCPGALDWFNGRRAPFSNGNAQGVLFGLHLGMDAVDIYAALARSVAFGTRAIHEHLRHYGIPIDTVRAVGGIPGKSPFLMQLLSDSIRCPVEVCATQQASARGAAIMAAVACGRYQDTPSAINKLCSPVVRSYRPHEPSAQGLDDLYKRYKQTGQALDPSFTIAAL